VKNSSAIRITCETYDKASSCFANRNGFTPNANIVDSFLSNIVPAGVILDVGCGEGRDILAFRQRGYKVVGMDISLGMLAIAKDQNNLACIMQSDMRSIPVASSSISGLWSWASIHHIPKAETLATFEEFRRVLKPKGAILITTKMGSGESMVFTYGLPRFFAFYESGELEEICSKSGFSQIQISTSTIANQTWIILSALSE
jgi:ubiquinone/menaquinone biosynthesis C-methylase UbiE